VELNDIIGSDDVYFKLNGITQKGVMEMKKGEEVSFGPARTVQFDRDVDVDLWEHNSNRAHDHIGTHTIAVSDRGEIRVRFEDERRGIYELVVEVQD
jgi:hypothetical protein